MKSAPASSGKPSSHQKRPHSGKPSGHHGKPHDKSNKNKQPRSDSEKKVETNQKSEGQQKIKKQEGDHKVKQHEGQKGKVSHQDKKQHQKPRGESSKPKHDRNVPKVNPKKISKDKKQDKARDQKKKDKVNDQKKKVVPEPVSDDESSESVIEYNDDVNIDNQNEVLGALSQMKRTNTKKSRKDKERKVTEFKFRVLDLLEIFVKKTKNPHIFILSLQQIFQSVEENSFDKDKSVFLEKICSIIRKYFEKNFKMLPEYQTNVDECFVEVVKILAKQQKKNLNSALTFAAVSLLKIRLQMNLGDLSVMTSSLEKALEKTALKKGIFYSEELYKEVIRSSPEVAYVLLNSLLKLSLLNKDGGAKDKNRPIILSLLSYAIRNQGVQKQMKEQPALLVEGVKKLMSVLSQQEEIKKKKIGVLNKYSEIFSTLAGVLKEVQLTSGKEELIAKMKEAVSSWPEKDHNLQNISKKLVEKFVF